MKSLPWPCHGSHAQRPFQSFRIRPAVHRGGGAAQGQGLLRVRPAALSNPIAPSWSVLSIGCVGPGDAVPQTEQQGI